MSRVRVDAYISQLTLTLEDQKKQIVVVISFIYISTQMDDER